MECLDLYKMGFGITSLPLCSILFIRDLIFNFMGVVESNLKYDRLEIFKKLKGRTGHEKK